MSFRSSIPAAAAIAAVLALGVILSPAPLAAQYDSTMMSRDSAMSMPGDSGMMMSHDSMTMDHGKMMDHDGMGAGADAMMFMGAEGRKAAGDYALTETGGKQQLTLTKDFSVTEAPDLYLVLANGPTPGADALYVGKLKKASGAQTFELPKGKDLTGYSTLLVWSKKDKRAVASAEWHATSGKMMDH
jgi:electron transfer DM13